jgi:DNA-binding response OmpR family regulator
MRAGGSARPSTMRTMPRVLVVDDEPKIVRLVGDYLEHAGFAVIVARDGREALMRAGSEHPDLIVLDLGLPGLDGVDVTRTLRRSSGVPLIARVRAVLRRNQPMEPETIMRIGELEIDVPRLRATVSGRTVPLTATEFQLLATMARQPGRVFTRSQLLDAIHGEALEAYERAIDAHVKNIRRKLEPDPRHPRYLQTVYGVGYRMADA